MNTEMGIIGLSYPLDEQSKKQREVVKGDAYVILPLM